MEYFPDKSLLQCYESLNKLHEEARELSKSMAVEDEEMASMFATLYISSQNQTMLLWHHIANLEKKIDTLLSRDNPNSNKRFEF